MYHLYENGELSIKDCNFQDQMTDLLKGTLEHAEGLVKTVDLITLQEWIDEVRTFLLVVGGFDRPIELASSDSKIRFTLKLSASGCYQFDLIDETGAYPFNARIEWVEPTA